MYCRSDPYVVIHAGADSKRSLPRYKTLTPEFMERFRFRFDFPPPLIRLDLKDFERWATA